MRVKVIKQTTWTIETIPVQKRKRSTGEQSPEQNVILNTIKIITYNAWKELGFQVQKGQKAVAQFTIWKHCNGKVDEETGEEKPGKMFMKKASFFTAKQVQAIA